MTSAAEFKTVVTQISDALAEGPELAEKRRKKKGVKKVGGYEELKDSLHIGGTKVDNKLKNLSLIHGSRFDAGDKESLARILKIQTEFREKLTDVLKSSIAEGGGEKIPVDPVELYRISEMTQRDTLLVMEELAQRLEQGDIKDTDPDDILPPMPLHEPRKSTDNPNRTSDPQQTEAPKPPPVRVTPVFDNQEDSGFSQSLTRRSVSSRDAFDVITRMFSMKPRPYYLQTLQEPIPAVVPSYKITEDSSEILEEMRDSVSQHWEAVESAKRYAEVEQTRLYSRSAPLPQGPWRSPTPDDARSISSRKSTERLLLPPSPEPTPSPMQALRTDGTLRPNMPEKRNRSEPAITFSKPTPRFGRNVSGPPNLSAG